MDPLYRFNHERQLSTPSRPLIGIRCPLCYRVATRYILMRRVIGHLETLKSPVRVTLSARCADCNSKIQTKVRIDLDRKVHYESIRPVLVEIGTRRR